MRNSSAEEGGLNQDEIQRASERNERDMNKNDKQ